MENIDSLKIRKCVSQLRILNIKKIRYLIMTKTSKLNVQKHILVAKKIFLWTIRCSKSGSLISSVILPLDHFITFLPLARNIFKFYNFGRSTLHHGTIQRLIDCFFLLPTWFSPSRLGTLEI